MSTRRSCGDLYPLVQVELWHPAITFDVSEKPRLMLLARRFPLLGQLSLSVLYARLGRSGAVHVRRLDRIRQFVPQPDES